VVAGLSVPTDLSGGEDGSIDVGDGSSIWPTRPAPAEMSVPAAERM
jgi:hypothetical protein